MDESDRKNRDWLIVMTLVGFCVSLPLLYIISSGPALRVTVNAPLPASWWSTIYWPLTLARDAVPGFHQSFQWYLDLWV